MILLPAIYLLGAIFVYAAMHESGFATAIIFAVTWPIWAIRWGVGR